MSYSIIHSGNFDDIGVNPKDSDWVDQNTLGSLGQSDNIYCHDVMINSISLSLSNVSLLKW